MAGLRWGLPKRVVQAAAGLSLFAWSMASQAGETRLTVDVHEFRIVPSESGPTNYYAFADDGKVPFIRAEYRPGMKTAVFGFQVPDALRSKVRAVEWSWRARTMPKDRSACDANSGIADSPALVYVIWKRALRWYSLRYVWSTTAPRGSVCGRRRNPFVAQDTVVLESGTSNGAWLTEHRDVAAEFRRYFADGDPAASVPDLVGVGLLTDGDQSQSESAADYTGFALVY